MSSFPTKGLGPAFLYALAGSYAGVVSYGTATDALPACQAAPLQNANTGATPMVKAQDNCDTLGVAVTGGYSAAFFAMSGICFRNRKRKSPQSPSIKGHGGKHKNR